jgi:hypothetical protein
MAKKNHDMKKTERVQHLMDLFKVNECMDKAGIDQRLSAKTGIPEKDLRQSTYRDLRELVDLGRLCERKRMMTGATKLHDDGSEGGPYKSEWYLPETKGNYIGAGLISRIGAKLFYSERLKGLFKIISLSEGQSEPEDHINFSLRITGREICLSVDVEALPFSIVIGRFIDKEFENANQHFAAIEKRFGHRMIYFHIDSAGISRFKTDEVPGHCILEFFGHPKLVTITDFGSTNFTFYEVRKADVLHRGVIDETVDIRPLEDIRFRIQSGVPIEFELPGDIFCGNVRVRVYGS